VGGAAAARGRRQLSEAIAALERRLPKVAQMLADSEEDILAFCAFPAAHWSKLRSTNPLERFNKEIGRRTDVVGIFPDDASVIRLAGDALDLLAHSATQWSQLMPGTV
jgi:putative transposase